MGALEPFFESLPFAQACRRIDFDSIEVREPTRGGRMLLVSGIVALPLDSFQGRLGIEIVGATKSERKVLTSAPIASSTAG